MPLAEPCSAVSMMGYNLFRTLRQLAALSLTAVMAFVAVPVLMHPGYLTMSAAAKSGGSGGAGGGPGGSDHSDHSDHGNGGTGAGANGSAGGSSGAGSGSAASGGSG